MGTGVIAYHGHGPAMEQTPGITLASVYDPNPEQLAKFCARFPDCEPFTDRDAFFQSGIDAVSICSPAPSHLANVREAVKYGKHILCEKPLAMNDADIQTMARITDEAGLMLVAGFCYRFSPVAQTIRDLIARGAIGEVRAMRLHYIWNLHGKDEYGEDGSRTESSYRVGRMLEGGPMVDCGVHQIDLARWWTGAEIVQYQGHGAWIDTDYEAPDHVWLHLDHENGCHTAVEMSFSYTHTAKDPIHEFTYEVLGTDGLIRYDRHGWFFEMRNSHETRVMQGSEEKNFVGMYHAWSRALRNGHLNDQLPTAHDGLLVTRIARKATQDVMATRLSLMPKQTKRITK